MLVWRYHYLQTLAMRDRLEDHRRQGKRLVPPLADLGPLHETAWVDGLLPELLWIGLLQQTLGVQRSVDVCGGIAKAVREGPGGEEFRGHICRVSAFTALSQEQRDFVHARLAGGGFSADLNASLAGLVAAYPGCPVAFLTDEAVPVKSGVHQLKATLPDLFNRWEYPATMVQVTATYMAFCQDKLKVAEGTSLANFPAVKDYPQTEESQAIASACRATVNVFFTPEEDYENAWAAGFWNRGLELEPCSTSASDRS